MANQLYEYRVVNLRESVAGTSGKVGALQLSLNQQAADGWRLKWTMENSFTSGGTSRILLIFERPK